MIGYVCIGTNDLARAARFYDQLTAVLGAERIWDTERFIGWGRSATDSLLLLIKPLDGKSATVGNGTMVSLAAESRAMVDAVYNKALALGGQDEGPPGARSEDFYAAYFRDSEANKLAVYYSG
jgi:catechol 2,3-dioxygenase-like lactoylglutathione lyase family enzyme